MLAFQIAAGIVIAAVVLRFWRQSLWLAAGLVGLAIAGLALLWLTAGHHWQDALLTIGAYAIIIPVMIWASTLPRSRRPTIRQGPPP